MGEPGAYARAALVRVTSAGTVVRVRPSCSARTEREIRRILFRCSVTGCDGVRVGDTRWCPRHAPAAEEGPVPFVAGEFEVSERDERGELVEVLT